MSRGARCCLCLIVGLAAHWEFELCKLAAAEPPRPNIVFILLDNVGQEWFGCYGSEEHCTPNIDELARTGVRVENCYTPPVCGPSRVVLLTGRYPHSTGFRLHHDAALYSGGGLPPEREIIFPRLLRDAGYATGITGKWQINNLYDEPDALTRHGFQESLVWPGSIDRTQISPAERDHFQDIVRRESYEEAVAFNQHIESRYWDPVFLNNGRREERRGKFGPDESRDFALDFLRRRREQPFLLYLPLVLTHGQSFTQNVVPTPANRDPDRPHHEMFADMLRYADGIVGDMIDELDRLGLRDNTFVFVASDNGTEKSLTARRNGRDVQGDLYSLSEAGGNVVLLANSPHHIPGGRTIPLADFTDIYPTVCELAGVPLSSAHRPDGRSFARFLLGTPGAAPPRTWILNEYDNTRVVRDTRFKLYSDGRLFDANSDPVEQHDLSGSDDASAVEAKERLQAVLDGLPADAPPPFRLRSLSAFKIRAERPNVLLILVDDLKPALGCYGDTFAHSPNIDRLAARGLRFDRAYCNQAVCAPSRNTLLTGSRSTSLGVYDLGTNFRQAVPDAVTLPQYFRQYGYTSVGVGKAFHIGHGNHGDDASWSHPFEPDKVVDYVLPASTGGRLTREEALFSNKSAAGLPRGAAWEQADVADDAYADGRIARRGIHWLRTFETSGEPFFLALGFVKPHLPFCAPRKYWNLYDLEKLPRAEFTTPPLNAPPYVGKTLLELNQYEPIPNDPPLTEETRRTLVHGYYAALSYMDAQIGRVLDEFDRLQLARNTIVVLWSDHGYHLGDHGMWTKHTNYEQANRIPLIISAPGVTQSGSSTQALVESVDLFPTLCDLAGLPAPGGPQPIDGQSLRPILTSPETTIRDHAYHCFPRGDRLGRAIRTQRYRLVEWKRFGAAAETAEYELYDYEADPLETRNLASEQPETVAALAKILARHPEARRPIGRR